MIMATKARNHETKMRSFVCSCFRGDTVLKRLRLAFAVAIVAPQLLASDVNDWPSHDHDAGGQRFSPLKQITPFNVATLQLAWSFDTGVTGIQVTPLVVGGRMYVTAGREIIALEPETGKVLWKYAAPGNISRR